MDSEAKDGERSEQKSPFENLGHPELVKRCTKFLSIAQSAKHAKDTYKQLLSETETKMKHLEEQLSKFQQDGTYNAQCKECEKHQKECRKLQNQVSAMEEMVATLTEQKLSTAMEMDRLKKQNELLESQLIDFRRDNEKLKAELDERLHLEKRLETTEVELATLESTHQLCAGKTLLEDEKHVHMLQCEIEELNRDLEVLSSDSKNKSKEIWRLSEQFYNEKCALEEELTSMTSKAQSLSHMNDYLKEQLRVISEEKDVVLKGIESIKSNNFELNQLVESIGSERDECLHNVEKLNAEKSKLSKLINALNSSKTTILEENLSLKSEKQHLNECLKKLTCERDALRDSVTTAEMYLSRMLEQLLGILQKYELSVVDHLSHHDEVMVDKKMELTEIISILNEVTTKLCTVLNTQQSLKQCVCSNFVDVNVNQQINDCNKFISFECSEDKDFFTKELEVLSTQLMKICYMAESFKSHESNFDVNIILKQVINCLKTNVSDLESKLDKQYTNEDGIHLSGESSLGPSNGDSMSCFEGKPQLDNKLSLKSDILDSNFSDSGRFENNTSHSLTVNSLEVSCLEESSSKNNCIGTQTENVTMVALKELCEKCVQADICASESNLYPGSFAVTKEMDDANMQECENKDEKMLVETLKDQLQALHVKNQENSEKLACAEKELEMLQSVISEKDADMNKFLDILLCLDGKNSKNARNQVFEKLQKDKASYGVEGVSEAVANLLSQNVIESLSLLEESDCTNKLTQCDGDVLASEDGSVSPASRQNVLELKKMVSKKKEEILQLNELKLLNERQCDIIAKQEREICCLSRTIEELKAVSELENKIVAKEEQQSNGKADSSCHSVVEAEFKISAGNDSRQTSEIDEKQDQTCNDSYSELVLTFNKQKDEISNLQRVLDEKSCELENLKSKLQLINTDSVNSDRPELIKLVEEKENECQYNAVMEARKLENSEEREVFFQQEPVDKTDKVDGDEKMVAIAENLSSPVECELFQKQEIIDEQKNELENCRQEIQDFKSQVTQLLHQVVEKEEMISKLGSDVENYKQRIVEIEQMCQEMKNEAVCNQQLIAAKDSEIEAWKQKCREIEEHMKKIEVELVEKQQMCDGNVNEIDSLQKCIGELQEKYTETEQNLFQEQQRASERVSEIEKLNSEIVERNDKIESCMKEMEAIENQFKEAIEEKDAAIEQHKKNCLTMQHNLDELRNKFSQEKQMDRDTENHRKQIENIMQQCMEADIKLNQREQVINELNHSIEEYKRNNMNMQEQLKGTENIQRKLVDDMRSEIKKLRSDLAVADASLTDKTTQLKIVREELGSLQNSDISWTKTMDDKNAELDNIKLEAAKNEEALREKIQEIEDLKRSKEAMLGKLGVAGASLRALRTSHEELLREGQQLRSILSQVVGTVQQEMCRQVESAVASSKMEVKELLGEMNEMNQVLKQRGETISKLKELKAELEQRWESASSELLSTKETLSARVSELQEKDDEINTVKEQLEARFKEQQVASREQQEAMDAKLQKATERIAELESKIAQLDQERDESQKEGGEVQSEVMSSSTISKMEETARLRDLEGSFEERFTKLRIFTVKLKKKAADLKEQLTQTEAEKSKLMSEKAELLSKISVMSGHTKNLQTLQQEYDCLQDEIEAQKSEVKTLKKALEAAVNDSTAVKLELQSCREEKESLSRELESCTKSKQKLDTSVKELLSQVQSLKKEKDAENSARKEKESAVKRLEEELKLKELRIVEESEKVKLLNDKIEESKQESVKNNVLSLEMAACEDQLRMAKSQQRELAALVSSHEATIDDLKLRLEQKNEQCENMTLQLAELALEKQNLVESFRNQQELLTRQIHALEEQCTKLKDSLAEREDEFANLRDEYESYKVRAQSVLRQKARGDEVSQFSREDLLEETRQLKVRVETLQARLEETNLHLQSSLSEQEVLREEKALLFEKWQELTNSLSQARSEVQQLNEAKRKLAFEHQEAIRNQKLHYDTLTQCYKSQIEDLEARLQNETSALKQRLETAEELLQKQQVLGNVDTQVHPQLQKISADGKTFETATPDVEISLLKREDAEGSESTNSVSPNHLVSRDHLHHPVPLDKLLATTDEDKPTVVAGTVSSEELTRIVEQAAVSDQQVRHLSALLSDAEQDLAKLTQQNGLLKEEIRRQQRSIEREQHAQNFEYLKNVVVKFATLQNGDERSRLVPVLNTILKLSPEETNQLAQVARGGMDSSGSARGWGSYLHLWPGAQ